MKHIIAWKLSPTLSPKEKATVKANAKSALEGLCGNIPGLLSIELVTDMLDTSTGDMLLISEFADKKAYAEYKTHPLHVAAADEFVRPYTVERLCCDYE